MARWSRMPRSRLSQETNAARNSTPDDARVYFALAKTYAKVHREAEAAGARAAFARLNKQSETNLGRLLEPVITLAGGVPVDHVVERGHVFRPAILILQVVGMLPHVDAGQRLPSGAEHTVLIGRGFYF